MKVMISACLLGENCKYNGGNNLSEEVVAFAKEHEVIPICPEVLGGLSTPRPPAELVNGKVSTKNGILVDQEFRLGAKLALEKAIKEQVELVILQSRSPSCGVKQIYDGTFTGTKVDGQGVCAKLLMDNGFHVIDVEELLM